MRPDQIAEAFRRFHAANPAPQSDLEYRDAYTLLVAVVLSAQATDAGVNKATRLLFQAAADPAAMVALGEDRIRAHIKTIGLFNAKAKNVLALSTQLLERHGGQVPRTRKALMALPGVGRKTANVVLNVAFGQPTMAVDTHVFRVANRTRMAVGRTPEAVERGLVRRIPRPWRLHGHHWLILHGRYVCIARKPKCPTCLIQDLCPWPRDGDPPALAAAAIKQDPAAQEAMGTTPEEGAVTTEADLDPPRKSRRRPPPAQ